MAKALAFDVGKHTGIAFWDDIGVEVEHLKFQTLNTFHQKALLEISKWNPDGVIVGRPTRYPQVIAAHSKYLAMIELACEKRDVPYFETIDSEAKKFVLGNGTAKKDEIGEWAKGFIDGPITEDEADAMLFARFLLDKMI